MLKQQFITPEFTRNLLWSYKKQQYPVIRNAVDYNCNKITICLLYVAISYFGGSLTTCDWLKKTLCFLVFVSFKGFSGKTEEDLLARSVSFVN